MKCCTSVLFASICVCKTSVYTFSMEVSRGKLCQSQCCSKRQAAIFTKSWFKRLSRILFKPQKHRKGMDKHTSVAEEPGSFVECLNMPSGLQN